MHLLVTGVNRGLGAALAQAGLARGWRVSGTLRQGTAPAGVTAHPLEMTDFAGLSALADRLGPLDCLIANAGVIGPARQDPLEMDFDGFLDTLRVNTLAPLALVQALLPNLRAGGAGRVLAISSGMAWMGYRKADRLAYRASKAALNKVMQGLATALEPERIPVAVIDPGWLRTDMGGPDADLPPEPVARDILDTAAHLDMARTGQFLTARGTPRPF
ncbi:SDR family NAD(P)-dependent oxidoreductase [Phaeovulum vinaykumarii]|uniref:Short-chain dehydrogenase n=1 Tax=Phaeovulum vinaykumarii TaxID=407234 RepID=A0A1N7LXJ1_9RHOB|nr:SDR family NAD(P)-dependent oxidoreductase [Phaeovulum vinaykumarii]SIS78540.1 Short-chain dehydrogenase [Phaeovulum vinaykumarii]SOC06973.1 short-subunit dehydrogenase [Phaeovulum vinaykumarii]